MHGLKQFCFTRQQKLLVIIGKDIEIGTICMNTLRKKPLNAIPKQIKNLKLPNPK